MHALYYGGWAIGMHDRLKRLQDSRPEPSQSNGLRESETNEPERSCSFSRNLSHSTERMSKELMLGGKAGPSEGPEAKASISVMTGSLASAAVWTYRMCFLAVRGSTQPSASQATPVNPRYPSPPLSRSFTSPSLQKGLRGMRCSGNILLVCGRPVPRDAGQRIVATRR
jgi:hypothetical protein